MYFGNFVGIDEYFAVVNAFYPVIIHIHSSRRQPNQNPWAVIVVVKAVEQNTNTCTEYNMKKLYVYSDGNDNGGGNSGDDDDDEEEEKNRKRRRRRRKKLFSTTAAAIYNHFSIIPFRTLFPLNALFRHIYI